MFQPEGGEGGSGEVGVEGDEEGYGTAGKSLRGGSRRKACCTEMVFSLSPETWKTRPGGLADKNKKIKK